MNKIIRDRVQQKEVYDNILEYYEIHEYSWHKACYWVLVTFQAPNLLLVYFEYLEVYN